MTKVSIVMPIYNGSTFLRESIESILKQSLEEFEIICINDASDDCTLDILEEYQRIDNRVIIISNEKRNGAAYSRNRGMREARGEYLAFLDSDDIFDEDMLFLAYNAAKKFSADIVEYPYKIVESENIHKKIAIRQSEFYKEHYCKKPFSIKELQPKEFMNCHSAPWNKLFRAQYIKEEELVFQDLSCCNDIYFVNMALLLAKKVIFLSVEKVIVYVRSHNTPSRISYNREPMNAFYADIYTAEQLIKRGILQVVYNQFYYKVYCHLMETLRGIKDEKKAREFYHFLQSEGIDTLLSLGYKDSSTLDKGILSGYNKFFTENYDTEWYLKEGEFELYLEEKKELLYELFHDFEANHKKVGLWGAGRNGRAFLNLCNQLGIGMNAIYDIDPNKEGGKIESFPPIKNPQVSLIDEDIIIITSSNILQDVNKEIKKIGKTIEVIDINQYLDK